MPARPARKLHRLRQLLFVHHAKTVARDGGAPFVHRPGADMARIAEALECIDIVPDRPVRNHIVDDGQAAARLEHTPRLIEEGRYAVEMMRRDPAGDEVERSI